MQQQLRTGRGDQMDYETGKNFEAIHYKLEEIKKMLDQLFEDEEVQETIKDIETKNKLRG